MSQHEVETIELSMEEARKTIKLGETAKSLSQNSAFKSIIMEGYFVEEASRLAILSSDPNISDTARAGVMRDLAGIGALKRYLHTKTQMGEIAARALAEAEEELAMVRAEEAV